MGRLRRSPSPAPRPGGSGAALKEQRAARSRVPQVAELLQHGGCDPTGSRREQAYVPSGQKARARVAGRAVMARTRDAKEDQAGWAWGQRAFGCDDAALAAKRQRQCRSIRQPQPFTQVRTAHWGAAATAPHHQNEAISSNSVVHMASVPTAMNTDCDEVGSCSSSDITHALCNVKPETLSHKASPRRHRRRKGADWACYRAALRMATREVCIFHRLSAAFRDCEKPPCER